MVTRSFVKLALAASVAGSITGIAVAQETSAQNDAVIESIVVTAQRREERLQDVPMSITALSSDTLEKQGVTNITDIARAAPSVNMPQYGSFLQPSIRGVSSTGANLGDNSNVALYVDGVYQPQQIATLIDLPDVQQIEVLKGPQGALYGQNATGGVILVNSLAPSFESSGKLSASYGNYEAMRLRGYYTGALSETVAASIAIGYEDREGFRKQVMTGERDQGLNSEVYRGKVLFQPNDEAAITFTGYYTDRSDSSAYAGIPLANNTLGRLYNPGLPDLTDPDHFATDPESETATTSYGASLKGVFDLEAGTLSALGGYSNNSTEYHADIDYSPVHLGVASTDGLDSEWTMLDVNFGSRDFGPISFLVGGFYMSGEEVFDKNILELEFIAPTTVPSIPVYFNGVPGFQLSQGTYSRLEKEVFAAYADVTYKFEDLTITAGGRYTDEEQNAFSNDNASFPVVLSSIHNPANFTKFSPRVTASYALSENSNVYISWGKGFKSGIINTANLEQTPVDPEIITSTEIGYKGLLVDGTVSLNVAVFNYDYKDLQVVSYLPSEGQYLQQNAAEAEIKGVDLDVSWFITEALSVSASVSWLDAEYTNFSDAQTFVPTGFGNVQVIADLSGQDMLRAPDVAGTLSANYERDTSFGLVGAFIAYYFNDGYGFEISNRVRNASYESVDAELSLVPAEIDSLRVVLWGKNLADEAYLASVLTSDLVDGASYAPPRTFGLRAEYSF